MTMSPPRRGHRRTLTAERASVSSRCQQERTITASSTASYPKDDAVARDAPFAAGAHAAISHLGLADLTQRLLRHR